MCLHAFLIYLRLSHAHMCVCLYIYAFYGLYTYYQAMCVFYGWFVYFQVMCAYVIIYFIIYLPTFSRVSVYISCFVFLPSGRLCICLYT